MAIPALVGMLGSALGSGGRTMGGGGGGGLGAGGGRISPSMIGSLAGSVASQGGGGGGGWRSTIAGSATSMTPFMPGTLMKAKEQKKAEKKAKKEEERRKKLMAIAGVADTIRESQDMRQRALIALGQAHMDYASMF